MTKIITPKPGRIYRQFNQSFMFGVKVLIGKEVEVSDIELLAVLVSLGVVVVVVVVEPLTVSVSTFE